MLAVTGQVWSQTPDLRWFTCLGLSKCWDNRCESSSPTSCLALALNNHLLRFKNIFGDISLPNQSLVLCLFLRQGLTVSPRLEGNGAITVHCSLELLGSDDPPAFASPVAKAAGTHLKTQLIFVFFCRDEVSLWCLDWSQTPGFKRRWFIPVIPALWEDKAGGSQGQEFETSLINMVKPHLY
ncbi:Protein PPP5D1 [Plecturocebus cupreus]